MADIEEQSLLNSWNDLCAFLGISDKTGSSSIHYFDVHKYNCPEGLKLPQKIRLRIEMDTNHTQYGIYYGIYFTLPKKDNIVADDVNRQWKEIRHYIDDFRNNRYYKSHDCVNKKDVYIEDSYSYVYWPYWVKACEREASLILEEVNLIHKALTHKGFTIEPK